MGRTTINLAPADVKKEGPSFDLPIAIGMLAASEQIETDQLDNFIDRRRTRAHRRRATLQGRAAGRAPRAAPTVNRRAGAGGKCPRSCRRGGLQVIPVQNLREATSFLEGEIKIAPTRWTSQNCSTRPHDDDVDFAEVKGQEIGQARVRNRCGRRTQRAAHRPAGHGQIHARQTAADDLAAADVGRGARNDQDSQHRRLVAGGGSAS